MTTAVAGVATTDENVRNIIQGPGDVEWKCVDFAVT
jgi:hypothetical protein